MHHEGRRTDNHHTLSLADLDSFIFVIVEHVIFEKAEGNKSVWEETWQCLALGDRVLGAEGWVLGVFSHNQLLELVSTTKPQNPMLNLISIVVRAEFRVIPTPQQLLGVQVQPCGSTSPI